MMMEECEALVIRKSVYGESDYLVTLFTKKYGKVRVIARNAKKSQKRFGGMLEPFLVLKADISINKNRFNVLNHVTLVSAYSNMINSLESFAFASFILENVDFFTHECQQNEELFNESIKVFELVNKGSNLVSTLLKFQLVLLEINGIKPDFESCDLEEVILDITDGSLYEKLERTLNDRYKVLYVDIVTKPELMEIFPSKTVHNTKVLTSYIEHHVEKKFKTSDFLGKVSF